MNAAQTYAGLPAEARALYGWGRFPVVEARVAAPANVDAVRAAVTGGRGDVIARGLGRSYGDSSLAPGVIDMRGLDEVMEFDERHGRIRCGAGLSLSALLERVVPQGWFPRVVPGTTHVTVGGAIASDVHGKNHQLAGSFCDHVDGLRLLLADGSVVTCSRSANEDLFHATCGGMGLTGVILEAAFRLQPIRSAWLTQRVIKTDDLAETLEIFEQLRDTTYCVAWMDGMAGGKGLGRSLIITGEHTDEGDLEVAVPGRMLGSMDVPFDLPGWFLRPSFVRLFNRVRYQRVRHFARPEPVRYDRFFFPLDRIGRWNRLYGRRGFLQYQFVIPKEGGEEALAAILRAAHASGHEPYLAVLKLLGPANEGSLSFPMEGYTLALDFQRKDGLMELLDHLDTVVLDHAGRVYLTKDARMSADTFRRGYPGWEAFASIRERVGASRRFHSLQSRRLGID